MGFLDWIKDKLAPTPTSAPNVPAPRPDPRPSVSALSPQPWPMQGAAATAFFGDPSKPGWKAANIVKVACPWAIRDADTGQLISGGIEIHRKVAASLARVLAQTWEDCGRSQAKIEELGYHIFSGSYVYRPMRGGDGHHLSMHAYGAAIDWDDKDNPQHAVRHRFTNSSPLIINFKREGWIWGGNWGDKDVDAMHVQSARVR